MGLSNSDFSAIQREYERIQAENRAELEARRRMVFEKLPELRELEKKIGLSAMERFKSRLKTGNDDLISNFRDEIKEIEERKRKLLKKAGFPEDALEPRYHCPDCKDTGFLADRTKCRCFRARAIKLLYTQSNLDRITEEENFSAFSTDYYDPEREAPGTGMSEREYMKRVFAFCRSYAAHFKEKGGNILFQGNTGVGKTFLCNCIAGALIEECHSVIYMTAGELFDCLAKVRIDKTDDLRLTALHDYIFSCDLLVIDDLGTEAPNAWTAAQLFYLVNSRLLSRKSCVISTNLSMKLLRDTYSERVTSRLTSGYDIIPLYGDDIRRKKRSLS